MFRRLALLLAILAAPLHAAETEVQARESAQARLITAENAIAPDTTSVNAGLRIEMAEGWKTYWRTPGEVGLPPQIDWDGSDNLASAEILYPAPERFTAFEIENFGYGGEVTFPLDLRLADPGRPATLRAEVRILVCAHICIPEDFVFTLELPATAGGADLIDTENAARIAAAVAEVPGDAEEAGVALATHLDAERLVIEATASRPFVRPQVFPELGEASFGKPDIRLGENGTRLWASLPVLYLPEDHRPAPDVTLTDAGWAVTGPAAPLERAPAPPQGTALLAIAAIAVLGGLILNVMPCVLPVLSLKIGHALETASAGPARIRAGFLASAAGILAFMWALAAVVLAAQGLGQAVGWGVQFQSPLFLSAMVLLMVLFAANMAGGFEIALPASWTTRLGGPQGAGLAGDFATGAFAAVMATPCSAPFLGTAVAFALASGGASVAVIFTALGLGLALPYLLFAAAPGLVSALPRPGRWMVTVKYVLAGALGLTALWLLSVLWAAAGPGAAGALGALSVALAVLLLLRLPSRGPIAALVIAAGLVVPSLLPAPAPAPAAQTGWAAFDTASIAREVAAGRVVFVDVTADWCLTCKANKALVLDRAPVSDLLATQDVVPMQADWTRPDPDIQAYLESFGRYGIPFNAVYGPGAPNGVPLPELLTTQNVQDAVAAAR